MCVQEYELCEREGECACISLYQSLCLVVPSALVPKAAFTQCAPYALGVLVDIRWRKAVGLTQPFSHRSNRTRSEVVQLSSLGRPPSLFEACDHPAISVGLITAALPASLLPPLSSLLCFSILQYESFVFTFFLFESLFHLCVFSALYCCVGETQGKEGLTMHCGTAKGGGDEF